MTVTQSQEEFTYPMQCLRCDQVHDAAAVTVLGRYSDCSTWRCPNCDALIDDRPPSWGGSAIKVDPAAVAAEQMLRQRYGL